MGRPTAVAILDRAALIATELGRVDAQAYAARELLVLGIEWESLPSSTQHDVVARLERAVKREPPA
jgi:hypothetical protein